MLKPILTILFLFSTFFLFGQSSTGCADTSYRMRFSSPGKEFRFYTHCNTKDGGTVLVGRINDTASTASNIVVLKLNATGSPVWKKSFQNLRGSDSYFARIIEQSNGEIAAYGYSYFGSTVSKVILLKLAANGTLLWNKK